MKIIKKILRIICIILPAFAFVLFPADSHATTYSLDSFNAHGYYFGDVYLQESPQIWVNSNVASDSDFKPRNFTYLKSKFSTESGKCEYLSYNSPGYSLSGRTVTFGTSFYLDNAYSPSGINTTCNRFGEYGVNMPIYLENTIPADKMLNVMSVLPHNYMFSTTPFNGSRERDGIIYSGRLSLMSYLNNYFGSAENTSDSDQDNTNDREYAAHGTDVTAFKFPLNFYVTEEIDSAVIEGSISFLPTDSQRETYASVGYLTPDFLNHGHIAISYRYMYWNSLDQLTYNGSEILSNDCQWQYSNSLLNLTYVCSIDLDHTTVEDPGQLGMSLYFYTDDNNSYQMFFSEDVAFNEIRVTTNGQNSVVVPGSRSDDGSYPTVAPGMPDVQDSYGNWTDSFLNAIKFTFANPFLPLFSLFLAPDDCANIPTVATMLHSNQTRICPIYPSWIYPITTPVIMFICMMLLFGFLIRWLNGESFSYIKEIKS